MNIFDTHHAIVREYKNYIESFINIKKDHIRDAVQKALDDGRLWPAPLIQFNLIYKEGTSVASLISQNILHSQLGDVFQGYRLYHHQVEALSLGLSPPMDYLPETEKRCYTIHPEARREVLKRRLLLNHERNAEEVRQGLHGKKLKPPKAKKEEEDGGQGRLFGTPQKRSVSRWQKS